MLRPARTLPQHNVRTDSFLVRAPCSPEIAPIYIEAHRIIHTERPVRAWPRRARKSDGQSSILADALLKAGRNKWQPNHA